MLILLALELEVEDALADGQPAQLLDFGDLQFLGLAGDHLEAFEREVGGSGVLQGLELGLVHFVEVPEFVL